MDKACKNCRFCVYAHSEGKDKPYCERHSKYIENTILRSEWEMVSVPKPQTNADLVRSMSDEELSEWVWSVESSGRAYGPRGKNAWLNWLKSPVEVDK